MTTRVWRHTPNAISIARLLATPVLLVSILQHRYELFKWLLLACLLSDIADGLIARAFNLRSKLGAMLDSTADMIVFALSAGGVFAFQRPFISEHGLTIAALLGLYALEVASALWRYRRISSFHTILSRVAAYAQGIFVMTLFLWGYHAWIFYAMVVFSALSLSEEIVIVCVLREWKSDVRGLYWVLGTR